MWSWLLRVESMGRSMSVYAPVVLLEKFVTYARVVVLTWLLGTLQYGVWQLGVMVFNVAAAVVSLGTPHGVVRYVPFYQGQGQLEAFYRSARRDVILVILAMTVLALVFSPAIAALLTGGQRGGQALSGEHRLAIVLVALLNGLLLALYQNLQGFIRALRTFRLLAAMDLCYALAFTALAVALGAVTRDGLAVLGAHAASLALGLLLGALAAGKCLTQPWASGAAQTKAAPTGPAPASSPDGPALDLSTPLPRAPAPAGHALAPKRVLVRLLGFGLASMLAVLLWEIGNQVSAWFANRYHGTDQVGVFSAFRQLCQPVWVLSNMVWAVVFSHVVAHWEAGRRDDAVRMTNLTYKAVVLALMTFTVLAQVTCRWWSLVLKPAFRADLAVLAGLLMFYQGAAGLGLVQTVCRLKERPGVFAVITAVGVVANVVLAAWWVPSGGIVGAAWAAGASMMIAAGLAAAYAAGAGFRVHPACHALAMAPLLLLLPKAVLPGAWAVVLLAAAVSPLVFSGWEKRTLLEYARTLGGRRGGAGGKP